MPWAWRITPRPRRPLSYLGAKAVEEVGARKLHAGVWVGQASLVLPSGEIANNANLMSVKFPWKVDFACWTQAASRLLSAAYPDRGETMPVTAQLSRAFYDKLGEEIANELVDWLNAVDATYRADLRQLNQANFARFDAKPDQRLAELKADLVKWMFAFWAPTALAVTGLLIGFLLR